MTGTSAEDLSSWWQTSVSHVEPGVIELRGRPIAELLGRASFTDVIWLLPRGDLPSPAQRELLDAALAAGVDHGPQSPSVAIARMAITCGAGLNNAMASGANALGDVHGGDGEQCLTLLLDIAGAHADGTPLEEAAAGAVTRWRSRDPYVPGFGHRIHRRDPRREPLIGLVSEAAGNGDVPGTVLAAALAVETVLNRGRSSPLTMNVDGATAVVLGELGFPPPLARGTGCHIERLPNGLDVTSTAKDGGR